MTKPTVSLRDLCNDLDLKEPTLRKFMKVFQKERKAALDDNVVRHTFLPSFVFEIPSGEEKGKFLSLDIEGIPLRVVLINLKRKSFDLRAKQFMMPPEVMRGSGDQFFDFLAQRVNQFACENKVDELGLPLGITIAFPIKSTSIKSGSLIRWTKGFSCEGVINENFCEKLQEAFSKLQDLRLDVSALVSDSTATLLAAAWKAENCKIGLTIGTGTNISYVESMKRVPALSEYTLKFHNIIINTEYGNCGVGGSIDFLRTAWDRDLDNATLQPGVNMLEKMISSIYLGELVRRILVTASQRGALFRGVISERLLTVGAFEPNYLIELGEDFTSQRSARNILNKLGYPMPWAQDCTDLQYVCMLVWTRSAHLVAASLAGLLNHMRYANVTIGVDGTFYRSHPGYPDALTKKVRELTDPDIKFQFVIVDDGGGLGAALAANMASKDHFVSHGASEMRRDSFFAKFDVDNISSSTRASGKGRIHSTTSVLGKDADDDGGERSHKKRRAEKSSSIQSGSSTTRKSKDNLSKTSSKSLLREANENAAGGSKAEDGTKPKRVSPDKGKKSIEGKQDGKEVVKKESPKKSLASEEKEATKQHDESSTRKSAKKVVDEGSKRTEESATKAHGSDAKKGSIGEKGKGSDDSGGAKEAARMKKPRKSIPESSRGRGGTSRGSGVQGRTSQGGEPRAFPGGSFDMERDSPGNRRGGTLPSNDYRPHSSGNPGLGDEESNTSSVGNATSSSVESLEDLRQRKIGIHIRKRSTVIIPPESEGFDERVNPIEDGNQYFESLPDVWNDSNYIVSENLNSAIPTDRAATQNYDGEFPQDREKQKTKEAENKMRRESARRSSKVASRSSKIEWDRGTRPRVSDGLKPYQSIHLQRISKLQRELIQADEETANYYKIEDETALKFEKSRHVNQRRSSHLETKPPDPVHDSVSLKSRQSCQARASHDSRSMSASLREDSGRSSKRLSNKSVEGVETKGKEIKSQVILPLEDRPRRNSTSVSQTERISGDEITSMNKSQRCNSRLDKIEDKIKNQELIEGYRISDKMLKDENPLRQKRQSKRQSILNNINTGKGGGEKDMKIPKDESFSKKDQDDNAGFGNRVAESKRRDSNEDDQNRSNQANVENSTRSKRKESMYRLGKRQSLLNNTDNRKDGGQKNEKATSDERTSKKDQGNNTDLGNKDTQEKQPGTSEDSQKSSNLPNDENPNRARRKDSIFRLGKRQSLFKQAAKDSERKDEKISVGISEKKKEGNNDGLEKEGSQKMQPDGRKHLSQPNDENPSSQRRVEAIVPHDQNESDAHVGCQNNVKLPSEKNTYLKGISDKNKNEHNDKVKCDKIYSESAMEGENTLSNPNAVQGEYFISVRPEDVYPCKIAQQYGQESSKCHDIETEVLKEHQSNSSLSGNEPEGNIMGNRRSHEGDLQGTRTKDVSGESKNQMEDFPINNADDQHPKESSSREALTTKCESSFFIERQPSFVHLNPSKDNQSDNVKNNSTKTERKLPLKSSESLSRISKTSMSVSGIPASKFTTINSASKHSLLV